MPDTFLDLFKQDNIYPVTRNKRNEQETDFINKSVKQSCIDA